MNKDSIINKISNKFNLSPVNAEYAINSVLGSLKNSSANSENHLDKIINNETKLHNAINSGTFQKSDEFKSHVEKNLSQGNINIDSNNLISSVINEFKDKIIKNSNDVSSIPSHIKNYLHF